MIGLRIRRAAVCSAIAAAAAACGNPAELDGSAEPPRGGTLVAAIGGDIDSWNPYTTRDATAAGVLDLLYPRLVQETGAAAGPAFGPWLAESWRFSDDGLRLTFELREAFWSDGTPVVCDDVRFTFEAQRSEALAWPGAFLKQRIATVECPRERQAVFVFSERYPNQLLDANDNAIVPRSYSAVPFADWSATSWEDAAVTCGPFRIDRVVPGQQADLVRNEGWWGAAGVPADRVVLRVYADEEAQTRALTGGEIDVVFKVPAGRAAAVAENEDLVLHELPSLSYTYVAWNRLAADAYVEDRARRGCDDGGCDETDADILRLQATRPHPILADPAVRRALDMAVDRQDLVEGIWLGHARPGTSPIVSGLWAHRPGRKTRFDPAAAGELLDGAGWDEVGPDGVRRRGETRLSATVVVNAGNRIRRDALERIAASLRSVGVELVIEPLPRRAFATRVRNKQFDGAISGWWAGTRVQPQNLLHTRAAVNRGNNFGAWSTPESDELLDRAAGEATRDAAGELWAEWQRLFADEQPLTILYEETRLLGMRAGVQGPLPSYLNPFMGLATWSAGAAPEP